MLTFHFDSVSIYFSKNLKKDVARPLSSRSSDGSPVTPMSDKGKPSVKQTTPVTVATANLYMAETSDWEVRRKGKDTRKHSDRHQCSKRRKSTPRRNAGKTNLEKKNQYFLNSYDILYCVQTLLLIHDKWTKLLFRRCQKYRDFRCLFNKYRRNYLDSISFCKADLLISLLLSIHFFPEENQWKNIFRKYIIYSEWMLVSFSRYQNKT